MYLIFITAKLLLAALFLVAAISKSASGLAKLRKTLSNFGVPQWLIPAFSIALPCAEFGIALLLFYTASARIGAISAFALLLIFNAAIAANLALGRKPNCNCFGQLHSKPIGWSTFARNSALAMVACWLAWQRPQQPSESLLQAIQSLSGKEIALAVIVLLLSVAIGGVALMVLQLVRQNGRLLLRIEALEGRIAGANIGAPTPAPQPVLGLPIGSPSPSFEAVRLSGGKVSLDELRQDDKSVVLVFSDPACGPCNALLPDLAKWQVAYAEQLRIVLVSRGAEKANSAKAKQHGLRDVLLQRDREVAEEFQANGTPAAVIVRADGTIGSRLAMGSEAIASIVEHAAGKRSTAPGNGHAKFFSVPQAGLPIGDSAPPIVVSDLSGRKLTPGTFTGQKTLVLFWNPGCGFCNKMLPDLKAWERQRAKDDPELLLVSTGTVEANRAMGLQSRVLLDQESKVLGTFRASGTPSAVLIDAQGKIASELAIGAVAVFALLGAKPSKLTNTVRTTMQAAHAG